MFFLLRGILNYSVMKTNVLTEVSETSLAVRGLPASTVRKRVESVLSVCIVVLFVLFSERK